MKTGRISFPVISISNDRSVIIEIDTLGTCTYQAVRNGYYENLQLLDYGGNSYRVVEWEPGKKIESALFDFYC